MNNPLVSVNILSFNRKDELRNTLNKVMEQNYKNIEIIVVDNASTDGTGEMVKSTFPKVKLIELKKNIGISGWNKGFEIANGEYVLVLDDDSYPTENAIYEGLKIFLNNSKIGIVSYKIFNTKFNIYEKIGDKENPKSFIGCGCLISKKLTDEIGYYNESYFIYYNELDFSARCYNSGYVIEYLANVIIIHSQNLLSRGNSKSNPFTSKYRFYHNTISYSIFLIQKFDKVYAIFYLLKWISNRVIICFKTGFFITLIKAMINIIVSIRKILSKRDPLKIDIQKFYDYGKIPLIDREYFPNFKKPSLKLLN